MKGADFVLAIRHRTDAISPHPDPLMAACRLIDYGRDAGERQALRRIVSRLAHGSGEYSEEDVHLLGEEALALVSALFRAREQSIYSEEEWQSAV